jgi:hypothetical protein
MIRNVTGAEGGERGPDGPRTRPDTRVEEVASAEPGKARAQWRAATPRARDVTGNLTASLPDGRGGPLMLAFANGITVRLEQMALVTGGDRIMKGGQTFQSVMDVDPSAGVYVYRAANEKVDATAPMGGLCGAQRLTFVAVSEFVSASGEWAFKVAPFRGASPPAPDATIDPQPCAALAFRLG